MAERITADEEQRRALAETLPPGTDVEKVVGKLESSKRRLLESRANRRSNEELKAERTKWQSRIKAWEKVWEVEEPEWWESNTAVQARARVREIAIRINQLSVGIQAFARRPTPIDRLLISISWPPGSLIVAGSSHSRAMLTPTKRSPQAT
jgi:hypothetical protein